MAIPRLELCSNGHEEVAYIGLKCPACEVAEDLQSEINLLIREQKDHVCGE